MKKIELKFRRLLRTIFGGVSLTAMAFVFQACYGPASDPYYDIKMSGTVKSKSTNKPIKGVKITVNDESNYGITDKKGKFEFYTRVPDESYRYHPYPPDSVVVRFLDIDGVENGHFEDKIVIVNPAHKDEVIVHVELEKKEMIL